MKKLIIDFSMATVVFETIKQGLVDGRYHKKDDLKDACITAGFGKTSYFTSNLIKFLNKHHRDSIIINNGVLRWVGVPMDVPSITDQYVKWLPEYLLTQTPAYKRMMEEQESAKSEAAAIETPVTLESTVYFMKDNWICEGTVIGIYRAPQEHSYTISICHHNDQTSEVLSEEVFTTKQALVNYLLKNIVQ